MTDLARMEILQKTAEAHAAAPWRGKGQVIEHAARQLGVAKQTVFRWLEDAGYDPGQNRKRRADAGQCKKASDTALTMVAGMMAIGARANGKQVMTLKGAVQLAIANNLMGPVATTSIARQLTARGMHPRQLAQPTPHINLQSLHPNHVWQIDASVCVIFYLADGGGMSIMDEVEFNRNKPKHLARIEKQRVIRYVVTDHYSGAFYLEYRLGAENQENLIEVFLNAITQRENEPFHGVPLILMLDKGSANTSHGFLNLLKRLQVTPLTHKAGNPRAKGQVENTHNIVETHFEGGRLRMRNVQSVDELNDLARQWRIAYNATEPHTRHGMTRYRLWMKDTKPEYLRIAPPAHICRDQVTGKDVPITVKGDLTIKYSIKGIGPQRYDVRHIPGVLVGGRVTVRVNLYRTPCIDIVTRDEEGREHLITLEPLPMTAAGFVASAAVIGEEYKGAPDTLADTARKHLLELAYNAANQEDAAKAAKTTPAFAGVIDPWADVKRDTPVVTWFPNAGTTLAITAPTRELVKLGTTKAALLLRGLLGRNLLPHEFRALADRFPEGVPEDALTDLAQEFAAPQTATIIPFKEAVAC